MPPSSTDRPWWEAPAPDWTEYWECGRQHREIVTRSICAAGCFGASLCVWGAGTCHDLDLAELEQHFGSITLVDQQADHVRWGIEFQGQPSLPRVKAFAPLDLAGIASATHAAISMSRSARLAAIRSAAGEYHLAALGKYDLVVSTGLISQLLRTIAEAVGPPADTDYQKTLSAVRRKHLQLIADHLTPGGTGLLITDIVTSDMLPALKTTNDLQATLTQAMAAGHHLHGLHPEQIRADFIEHPPLASQLATVQTSNYWCWQMPSCTYGCVAVQFVPRGAK